MRTRDEEEEEEEEDSSATTNTTHRPEWGSWGKVLELVVGKKARKQRKLDEWGVCVFVIAITSVVQRRERERERESWGEGKGMGVGLIETN